MVIPGIRSFWQRIGIRELTTTTKLWYPMGWHNLTIIFGYWRYVACGYLFIRLISDVKFNERLTHFSWFVKNFIGNGFAFLQRTMPALPYVLMVGTWWSILGEQRSGAPATWSHLGYEVKSGQKSKRLLKFSESGYRSMHLHRHT